MSLFNDEQQNMSSARVLLWLWSGMCMYMVVGHFKEVDNGVLAFMSGIEMALVGWAAGPRVMQYLGPQIGRAAAAVGQATSRFAPRNHQLGIQPTWEVGDDVNAVNAVNVQAVQDGTTMTPPSSSLGE
jgi:hypothetical protein